MINFLVAGSSTFGDEMPVKIGSSPGCTLLTDIPGVGAAHAQIVANGRTVRIESLSGCEVFVNGRRIRNARLINPERDEVRLGAPA